MLVGALCLLLPRTLVFVHQRVPVGPLAESELATNETADSGYSRRSRLTILRRIDETVTKCVDRLGRAFAVGQKKRRNEPRPTSGQFLSNWETWRREWREKRAKSIAFAAFNAVRAAGGTLLLLGAVHAPANEGVAPIPVLIVQLGILLIATLLQVVQFRKGIVLVSPTFYLSGVTIAWSGWDVGGFAVVAGFIFALAMRELRVLLPVMGLALVLSGYIAYGVKWTLLGNAAVFFLVILVALLTGRRLTFYIAPR